MSDLLSFLGAFFDGLFFIFLFLFCFLSLAYMFYVAVFYLFNASILIIFSILRRDKYFAPGMLESLNDHIWAGKIIEYKEYRLQSFLFDFYRALSIFNAFAILWVSFFISNFFYPFSFYLVFLFCLFKAYIFYKKRAIAKNNLNEYYESLREISRRIT